MADRNPENTKLVTVGFGDVVEFATLDSLAVGQAPVALVAKFVVTELISGEPLLSAAKIMDGDGSERLSRSGTMDPLVRKVEVEPWDVGRIAAAILWQFPAGNHLASVRAILEEHATAQPVEYPTF